jgi:S1-C subfamily serine protease
MEVEEIKKLHETFLYPIVRVFSKGAAGSGTIIYSKEDPEVKDEYQTFVLTNQHVVDDLITYKDAWDEVLKRNKKKENKERARVEIFDYVRTSEVDSSNRHSAEIVAYSKSEDLAILRILSPKKFDNVARLIAKDDIKKLKLFMDVVVSGCSLAHEPMCNFGQITFLNEIIENKRYIMANAGMIFGNSGGALFLKDTGELIGVPSRVSATQVGFGQNIVSWMGFSAHGERIYEFFDEQELKFLYDPNDTYKAAVQRRKDREEAEQKAALARTSS